MFYFYIFSNKLDVSEATSFIIGIPRPGKPGQETLTEGEGSVQLASAYTLSVFFFAQKITSIINLK